MPSRHPARCEICGRGPRTSHQISHAHNVSKRRQHLNIARHRVLVKGAPRSVAVCARCVRSGRVKKAG
ncbi:MAG: 50S ribosomal protein L28 [Candidatus Methylomirabilis oxyfera]|nr:50S ribosomal protein L28 [Candidatus Methylomirabilis oxyfera]